MWKVSYNQSEIRHPHIFEIRGHCILQYLFSICNINIDEIFCILLVSLPFTKREYFTGCLPLMRVLIKLFDCFHITLQCNAKVLNHSFSIVKNIPLCLNFCIWLPPNLSEKFRLGHIDLNDVMYNHYLWLIEQASLF